MNVGYFIKKHGGLICTVIATGGVIATSVMAVKATPEAMEIIEEEKPETKLDTVKATYKCYMPAAGMCLTTIAMLWCAFGINKHNYKEVLGAYALMRTTSGKVQNKIKELIGEEKFEEVRTEILSEMAEETKKPRKYGRKKKKPGYEWYYEPWSGQFFYDTEDHIREALHKLNGQIEAYQYASLNDFLDLLGLKWCVYGNELGWWSSDYDDSDHGGFYQVQLIEMDFEKSVIEGQECYLIKYSPVFVDPEAYGDLEHLTETRL